MTTQQLAVLEAQAEAEHRAEQAEQMKQAMAAVNQVAPQMGHISHVGLVASWNCRK